MHRRMISSTGTHQAVSAYRVHRQSMSAICPGGTYAESPSSANHLPVSDQYRFPASEYVCASVRHRLLLSGAVSRDYPLHRSAHGPEINPSAWRRSSPCRIKLPRRLRAAHLHVILSASSFCSFIRFVRWCLLKFATLFSDERNPKTDSAQQRPLQLMQCPSAQLYPVTDHTATMPAGKSE